MDGWMDGNCCCVPEREYCTRRSDAHLFFCLFVVFLVGWQSQQDDRPIPDGGRGGEKEEGGCRDANATL